MNIENKLLQYKKDLEETQSKIDQEKGALSSVLESLKDLLKAKKLDEKSLLDESEKRINYLEKKSETLNDELNDLIQEIEKDLE